MYHRSPIVSPFPKPFGNHVYVEEKIKKDNIYLNFAADNGGCGYYRMRFAENHINMTGMGQSATINKMIFDKSWYNDVKTIKLQRQASTVQKNFIEWLKSIQSECQFKLIYEVDDVVFREDIPEYNVYKHAFDSDEIRQNCIDMINLSDEVTVTCKYMRDLYKLRTGKEEITVVPNFMPYWWIGHQYDKARVYKNFETNRKKPRIVYAGSAAHFDIKNLNNNEDDFSHILKFVIDNRGKYQFIFIGHYPPQLERYIKSREIEFHPWKNLLEYPTFIESLNAQLFLAPLMDNSFNKSKSDIKFVEAAQFGIPCLCQDLCTYESAPEFLRFNTVEDMADKVDKILNWKNRSKYYSLVPNLRRYGESRFLENVDNIGAFLEPLNTKYGSSDRKYVNKWN